MKRRDLGDIDRTLLKGIFLRKPHRPVLHEDSLNSIETLNNAPVVQIQPAEALSSRSPTPAKAPKALTASINADGAISNDTMIVSDRANLLPKIDDKRRHNFKMEELEALPIEDEEAAFTRREKRLQEETIPTGRGNKLPPINKSPNKES